MRIKRRRRMAGLLLILAVPALLAVAWARLLPTVETLAAARVEDEASDLIAKAITDQMEKDNISYETIIRLEKDAGGNLLALRTDMHQLNRLRNETLALVNQRILDFGESELSIPLGNVLLPSLFSGRGPRLPVRVLNVSNADAEFTSQFQEAGINQTLHQITLQVAMNVTLLTPAGTQELRVDSGVVVAETILIGRVPDTMIHTSDGG